MKSAITILLTILLTTANGQTDDYNMLLDSAKTLFKGSRKLNWEELQQFDYYQIVRLLDKAIELNPKSAEARYFLGYAYSRINSLDGRGMTGLDLDLLYKSSEQFEKVIKLTPKYVGEIIVLDPHSKLTAEWGSMAMCYWSNNKVDSAIWAFKEGKRRGGFSTFYLELGKNSLADCSKNAILISSGDNVTFPLWYLQLVENYRTDVSVVDASLLNTNWYPTFLAKINSVSFDLPQEILDTIEYVKWADSTVTIDNFSWKIKPSYEEEYLLRGDVILLSLMKQNKFQRDLYFTFGFDETQRLSLKDYLANRVFIDKLNFPIQSDLSDSEYKVKILTALNLSKQLNLNNQDELISFDNFRYGIFIKTLSYLESNQKKAKELMELLDKLADEKKYPYQSENTKEILDYLRQEILKK